MRLCLVIVVLSLQKLTPIASLFSGISKDMLNDYYDMLSYDPGPAGWANDEDY